MIGRLSVLLATVAVIGFAQRNTGYPVAGKIVDAQTGAALAGVEIQIAPVPKPQLTETAVSSANGEFRFDHVPAGKYMLAAARPLYLPQYYLQHGNYNTGIVTGPNLDATKIVFPLHAYAAIFGRVVDEDNEPVPNAHVHIVREGIVNGVRSAYAASDAITGDDGRYRASKLPEGNYFAAVEAQPWYARQLSTQLSTPINPQANPQSNPAAQSDDEAKLDVAYPITFYPGTQSDREAEPIALTSGSQVEANFILRAVPAAHLTLTDSASSRQNAAYFDRGSRLHNLSLNLETHWGLTLSPGSAYFLPQGILFSAAPGRYIVHAFWSDSSGPHALEQPVQLQGKESTLDVSKLADSPGISAMADKNGGGLNGQASSLALQNLATGQILPAAQAGRGRVNWANHRLPPGRYEVVLTNPNGLYIRQITAANARVTNRIVEFTGKGQVDLKVSLGKGEASLAGRVMQQEKAIAGAMVLLLPQDLTQAPSLVRRDQSDSDGTFSLTDVVPGRYTLLAIPANENLEYTNAQTMRRYLASGTAVNVPAAGKYEVTAEMAPDAGL